ncbi:MAG: TlpA family protein disulfide reductase [Proteobacteria bacterium]|nr:TlpA family protein disulfide reductase [Pseudomonadota bacterium]
MHRLLTPLALIALAITPAFAQQADPSKVARIGTIAPAFALYAYEKDSDDKKEAVELDDYCGMRPGDTTAVLLLFVDGTSMDDLQLAQSWYRKFSRQGLEIIAVSQDGDPEFRSAVLKANLRFPVVDDRLGIVAKRYGVPSAPFSFVLNQECRVSGFSNKTAVADTDGLAAAVEAQVNGQIGSVGISFDD